MTAHPDYNIILVNLDGLRQDKIELCHNLNSLKEKGIYFSNMISASPYTLTAHHSIITGLYPSQHGIDSYYHMFRFKKDVVTLPELLKNEGYFTRCDCHLESLMNIIILMKIQWIITHGINKLLRNYPSIRNSFYFYNVQNYIRI